MLELHEPTILFTMVIFIAGIAYGQYMYRRGLIDGSDNVVNDLLSQKIIDIDSDGIIIKSEG